MGHGKCPFIFTRRRVGTSALARDGSAGAILVEIEGCANVVEVVITHV